MRLLKLNWKLQFNPKKRKKKSKYQSNTCTWDSSRAPAWKKMLAIHNAELLADQSLRLSAILSELRKRRHKTKIPNLATKTKPYLNRGGEGKMNIYSVRIEGVGRTGGQRKAYSRSEDERLRASEWASLSRRLVEGFAPTNSMPASLLPHTAPEVSLPFQIFQVALLTFFC